MQLQKTEVDLKPFVLALRRHWWWLPLAGLLMACVGLLWTMIRTSTYKATALVAVTQARPAPRLDDVETINDGQEPLGVIYNSLPQLAKGDNIVSKLLAETAYFDEKEYPYISLRGALGANPIMSPSLLGLSVTMPDRNEAMRLANSWAAILVDEANQLYDGYGEEQVVQYERQLVQLDTKLMQSQEALAAFEARNEATVLQNQLTAAVAQHAQYLADQRSLLRFDQDIGAFIKQMQLRDADELATMSDQVLLLAFQSKAYDVDSAIPIQLNFSDSQQDLDLLMIGEHVERMQSLSTTVDGLIIELGKQIEGLNPVIVDFQGRLQIVDNEADVLKRQINVSSEARTALARKVEESRIAAQTINRPLQIASSANVPEIPQGPRKVIVILAAGVAGGACALLIILGRTWLQQIGYLLVKNRQPAPVDPIN